MLIQSIVLGGWLTTTVSGAGRLISDPGASGLPHWMEIPAPPGTFGSIDNGYLGPDGNVYFGGQNSFALPPGTPLELSALNRYTPWTTSEPIGHLCQYSNGIAQLASGVIFSVGNARAYIDSSTPLYAATRAHRWDGTQWAALPPVPQITNKQPWYTGPDPYHVVVGAGTDVYFAGEYSWQDSVDGKNYNFKAVKWNDTAQAWTTLGDKFETTALPGVACVGLCWTQAGTLLGLFRYGTATNDRVLEEWNGTAWTTLHTFADFYGVGYVGAIQEAPDGTIWVAGGDANSDVMLVFRKTPGGSWEQVGNLSAYTDGYLNTMAIAQNGDVYVGGWTGEVSASLFRWNGTTWVSEGAAPGNDSGFGTADIEIYAIVPVQITVPVPQPDSYVNEPVTVNIYDYDPDELYTIQRLPDGVAPPGQEVEYLWNLVPGASSFPAPQVDPDSEGPRLVLRRLKPGRFLFRFTAQWGSVAVYEQDYWINVRPKPGEDA
jgi:hypothetical protein